MGENQMMTNKEKISENWVVFDILVFADLKCKMAVALELHGRSFKSSTVKIIRVRFF